MTFVRACILGCAVTCVFATTAVAAGKPLQLGHGQREGVGWSARLRDNSASESSHVACLEIALASPDLGSEARECGPVRTDLPLVERLALGSGERRVTVFAVVLPPAVERVALNLASRGYQKTRARHLSTGAAESLGLEPFAYLTRSFVGAVCIRRLRAFGDGGEIITDVSFIRCHES
jgi:hypothetical protein